MIFVQGWVKAAEKDISKVIEAAIEMSKKSNEEEGCLDYCFAQDISEANLFHITERWKSEDDLNSHFQTPHMAAFNTAIAGIRFESMDVRMYSGDEVRIMMQS
jgi:quinol monooxygenase YgiN